MIVTCPRCFAADDVTYRRLSDQMEYLCTGEHGNGRDHSWIGTQSAARWTLAASVAHVRISSSRTFANVGTS